jgi:hypothetical protein
MAGAYRDDEPRQPWRVALHLDEQATQEQQQALTDIFLGRLGGTAFRNFARAIGEVYAVRSARIALRHTSNQELLDVRPHVMARTRRAVVSDEVVSYGIPGHEHPGQEIIAETIQVNDGALQWEVSGRCGFATSFDYRSD